MFDTWYTLSHLTNTNCLREVLLLPCIHEESYKGLVTFTKVTTNKW